MKLTIKKPGEAIYWAKCPPQFREKVRAILTYWLGMGHDLEWIILVKGVGWNWIVKASSPVGRLIQRLESFEFDGSNPQTLEEFTEWLRAVTPFSGINFKQIVLADVERKFEEFNRRKETYGV